MVLRAMGIVHAVRRHGSAWVLLVPEPMADRASAELEAYQWLVTGTPSTSLS